MSRESRINRMTDIMAAFIGYTGKHLPDDILAKLEELRTGEDDPLALQLYDLMFENLRLAAELDRPSCQDTGVLQFWIRCGDSFPLMGQLESLLTNGIKQRENCSNQSTDTFTSLTKSRYNCTHNITNICKRSLIGFA